MLMSAGLEVCIGGANDHGVCAQSKQLGPFDVAAFESAYLTDPHAVRSWWRPCRTAGVAARQSTCVISTSMSLAEYINGDAGTATQKTGLRQ